jgi:hypothetical protein
MPLPAAGVNLWKTCEVSYLQLDSNSTALLLPALCEFGEPEANQFAKMVLLLRASAFYPFSLVEGAISDSFRNPLGLA